MNPKEFLINLITPASIILSALFATFIYSIGDLLLDSKQHEGLIWLIDTTIYSYIISCLLHLSAHFLNKRRTIVDISFYNPSQRNNTLFFDENHKVHTLKIYINVSGNSHYTNNSLRIYEPEGLTLQLSKQPSYINTYDGSYYEIDLSILMGITKDEKIIKKKNMEIKRSFDFQVTLDDDEGKSEYEDKIVVERQAKKILDCILLSFGQESIKIKR